MNVAVLGASSKPDRYSYKAVKMLAEEGHTPFPIHPMIADIDGIPVYRSLAEVPEPIHTISVYLSARNSDAIAEDILGSRARRISSDSPHRLLCGRHRISTKEYRFMTWVRSV